MSVPFSPEAEKALIGCIATSEGETLDSLDITPDHFFDFRHRVIFEAAQHLHFTGRQVNAITITATLGAEDLQKIGGPAPLMEICFHPSPAQAPGLLKVLEEKLMLRKAQEVLRWGSEELTRTKDAAGFCEALNAKTAHLGSVSESENIMPKAIAETRERLKQLREGRHVLGMETPWATWNAIFGGLVPGMMYALAGRPGTGKTSLMEQLSLWISVKQGPVLVFEKDMSPQVFAQRMAFRCAGVPYWKYVKGRMSPQDITAVEAYLNTLETLPIKLYSPSGLTAEKLCAIVRREKRLTGIKAVFLDHVQVLKVGDDLREGLTQASLILRENITNTDIPHVILAHLNRHGAEGRPRPEDIKEFDQLFGDCDGMALLWNEVKPEDCKDKMRPVNLFAAKNRNGPVVEETMLFDGELMSFRDMKKENA